MNIREEQTTGFGPNNGLAPADNYPVTKVFDGDKFLGSLRNDGYRCYNGEIVNDWVAFAGGAMVPMPAGAHTDRETAKRTLVEYAQRAAFAWKLAGVNR